MKRNLRTLAGSLGLFLLLSISPAEAANGYQPTPYAPAADHSAGLLDQGDGTYYVTPIVDDWDQHRPAVGILQPPVAKPVRAVRLLGPYAV